MNLSMMQIENNTQLLTVAIRLKNSDVAKMLIPISNPKYRESIALMYAAGNGLKDVVEMLIPVSDPMANDSWALKEAVVNGHRECAELLIPVSNVEIVKRGLNFDGQNMIEEVQSKLTNKE